VALYGDACNLFAYDPSEVEHKLDVLRQHCEQVGRDYNSIEKTVMGAMDPGPNGENVDSMLETMRAMHELGVTHFHGTVPDVASIKPLEILAERVIPEAAKF
jgi:alkanesulfonate monooxygenase